MALPRTVVFDSEATPKVTLTKASDVFTAIIEVEGLSPQRLPSAEEQELGVLSLHPPTVTAYTTRALIDAAQRAVQASIASTLGSRGTAAEISFVYLRTAMGVREALRQLDEDV
jgi:hypothetical protein